MWLLWLVRKICLRRAQASHAIDVAAILLRFLRRVFRLQCVHGMPRCYSTRKLKQEDRQSAMTLNHNQLSHEPE